MARTHASKLDELIRLSHGREEQLDSLTREIAELRTVVADQAEAIAAMKPTVDQVAAVFVFGRVSGIVWRWSIRVGIGLVAIVWWMGDRWHLLGPLLRRTP